MAWSSSSLIEVLFVGPWVFIFKHDRGANWLRGCRVSITDGQQCPYHCLGVTSVISVELTCYWEPQEYELETSFFKCVSYQPLWLVVSPSIALMVCGFDLPKSGLRRCGRVKVGHGSPKGGCIACALTLQALINSWAQGWGWAVTTGPIPNKFHSQSWETKRAMSSWLFKRIILYTTFSSHLILQANVAVSINLKVIHNLSLNCCILLFKKIYYCIFLLQSPLLLSLFIFFIKQ